MVKSNHITDFNTFHRNRSWGVRTKTFSRAHNVAPQNNMEIRYWFSIYPKVVHGNMWNSNPFSSILKTFQNW